MNGFDSELFARNGATQISANCEYGTPRYEVSFDLDSSGLNNLQKALSSLDQKDEITEIKSEIMKMHGVWNTPGDTLHEKIDNYCVSQSNTICDDYCGRYKIKYR